MRQMLKEMKARLLSGEDLVMVTVIRWLVVLSTHTR